ncbi:hypothetical protein C8R44DRAFT_885836 [Mycena epipterygia]|nr:hypothetical protein C8R44DRAFT_885836 [Mycena epipterygia]
MQNICGIAPTEKKAKQARLVEEFKSEVEGIQSPAKDQFEHDLAFERVLMRMTLGSSPTNAGSITSPQRRALDMERPNECQDGLSGHPTNHHPTITRPMRRRLWRWKVKGGEADLIRVKRDSGSQPTKLPAAMPRSTQFPIPPRAQDNGVEPNKEWKRNEKQRIENELETQIEEAKEWLERNMQSIRGMGP